MWTRIRAALALLVVLAIPVQGFAAATLSSCGPRHEGTAGGAAAHVHDAAAGSHVHARGERHAAQAAATSDSFDAAASGRASADAGQAVDAPDADGSARLGSLANHTCSACAACCIGSALPAAPLVVAVARTASEAIPSRHEPSVDFVVERLEHPPRSFLA